LPRRSLSPRRKRRDRYFPFNRAVLVPYPNRPFFPTFSSDGDAALTVWAPRKKIMQKRKNIKEKSCAARLELV